MCGLWASFGLSLKDAELAITACETRGPDSMGIAQINTEYGDIIFGHRRLSIYDLHQNANQPMSKNHLTIIFNGAIYNFKEIRDKLSSLGHEFTTQSDTEVFLNAWKQYGPECLNSFDGMYAFIIWDSAANILYTGRDRFGEKPLHIYNKNGKFALASEISQFQKIGLLKNPKINPKVARDFIDLGIAEAGELTFFEDIKRVPANTVISFKISNNKFKEIARRNIHKDIAKINTTISDPVNAAKELKSALYNSISSRLVADVKVGACLSGGVDSSAIVRIATQFLKPSDKLECICAVFDETDLAGNNLSEREYALAAADNSKIILHFVNFTDDVVVKTINEIMNRQGEPFAHSSIIAQYMVFKKAKELEIKVMLDGQGADELLGGYSGMMGHYLIDILLKKGINAWTDEIRELCEQPSDFTETSLKYASFNAFLPEKLRRLIAKFRGRWPQELQITKQEISYGTKKLKHNNFLQSLIIGLLKRQSLPSLLRYEDRSSMSFGIETRLPFLSNDVVKTSLSINSSLKVRDGFTKVNLRDAIKDIVPELIINRRKKLGFITPQDKWMNGALKSWIIEGVELAKSRANNILDIGKLESLMLRMGSSSDVNNILFRIANLGHFLGINDAII